MGYYSDYLARGFTVQAPALQIERVRWLQRITELRGRPTIVMASNLSSKGPISIAYDDILPLKDICSGIKNDVVDLIIETPGGDGAVADDIIKNLRAQFKEIGVIVPGCAKSAGTIIAMAGDEILMGPTSALGPIDAQVSFQGKVFSADAFIDGLEVIKDKSNLEGELNKAYIPILQNISPGDIQHAHNLLGFSKKVVADCLYQYKFKNWVKKKSGKAVSNQLRRARAEKIASELCNQSKWLIHGRSIKMNDLEDLGVKIHDYSKDEKLNEAIERYYALLTITMLSNVYKLFESKDSHIYKQYGIQAQQNQPNQQNIPSQPYIVVPYKCGKCKSLTNLQFNFENAPLQRGAVPYPENDIFSCPKCSATQNISKAKSDIEINTGKKIIVQHRGNK